jgi:hypothetical protein
VPATTSFLHLFAMECTRFTMCWMYVSFNSYAMLMYNVFVWDLCTQLLFFHDDCTVT